MAVYVEKPMVMQPEEFARVSTAIALKPILFTLGLNRRYSPFIMKLRAQVEAPIQTVTYHVNQQPIDLDHRTLDEFEGGGRLVSEAEHFIDICNFLIGRPPTTVWARAIGTPPEHLRTLSSFAITILYEGAVANILYDESGAPGFPRERVTASGRGQIAILDDFATLTIHGRKKKVFGGSRREMGHREALAQFVAALRGQPHTMLTWEDASLATICMLAAQESIRSGESIDLHQFRDALRIQ
jgi:predicted dehydrogenase